jgi:legumain
MKPENIITMAYDDIANDGSNPFPGQLFNKPSFTYIFYFMWFFTAVLLFILSGPGKDVYKGCQIDYKGEDVTPEIFLKILQGQETKAGNGKTLKSSSTDSVFINFSDHGASGLIAFPSSYLYSDQLLATLSLMSSENKFAQLVMYLEACESGSMFQGLPANIRVYATTASNAEESSWATYCDGDDVVNG